MTMQEYALAGRVVLPESVIENGLVAFSDGKITYVGTCDAYTGNASVEQVGTKLITPGFVDIHCHDAMNILGSDDPETVADYYLKHGTTSMLITLYRDLWPNEVHKATERVRAAMQSCKNIMGIHFEGPYMNPRYGCTVGNAEPVVPTRADYMPFVESGLVKQWTFVRPESFRLSAIPKHRRRMCSAFAATGCALLRTLWMQREPLLRRHAMREHVKYRLMMLFCWKTTCFTRLF